MDGEKIEKAAKLIKDVLVDGTVDYWGPEDVDLIIELVDYLLKHRREKKRGESDAE